VIRTIRHAGEGHEDDAVSMQLFLLVVRDAG